jgi:hypothetical protein
MPAKWRKAAKKSRKIEQDEFSDAQENDFINDHPIGHYFNITSVTPIESASRRTYGEQLKMVIHNIKHSPQQILQRIFELLTLRLLESSKYKGPPRFISLQLRNCFMETPFYVPFRQKIFFLISFVL